MAKIISVHEYVLKPNVDPDQFEQVILDAREKGVLGIIGLERVSFVKGIRGERNDLFAAIWFYESMEAWESLWGPVDHPQGKDDYPQAWMVWEDEILAPFLDRDPDKITFTTYMEI
jgi:hypothetical protein